MTATAVNPWAVYVEEEIRHMHRNGAHVDDIKFYLEKVAPKSAFTPVAAPTLGPAKSTNPQYLRGNLRATARAQADDGLWCGRFL